MEADFPASITFQLRARAPAEITRVVLSIWVDRRSLFEEVTPLKTVTERARFSGLTARCPGCTIGTQSDEAGWLQYCESKERNPSAAAEGEVQARKGKGVVPP